MQPVSSVHNIHFGSTCSSVHFAFCDCLLSIAILCAASSDVPFMADESALSVVPSLGKLTYSLKQYLTYAKLLQEKARQLSREGQLEHNV